MVFAVRKRNKIFSLGINYSSNPRPINNQPALKSTHGESSVQEPGQQPTSSNNELVPNPSSSNNVNSLTSSDVSNQKSQIDTKIKKNILKTLIVVSLAFTICLGPNQFFFLLRNLGVPLAFLTPFHHFSVYMTFLNCVINPFIYAAQYSDFRKQVGRLMRRARGNTGEPHVQLAHPPREVPGEPFVIRAI